MRPTRVATALLALTALLLAAALLAAANYQDDAPEQNWQFDLGLTIVRFGLPVLIAAAIVSLISILRSDR
jgi:hypothetical protein